MQNGHIVFSPISHSHPISLTMDNSLSHEFWLNQDKSFVEWADEIYVLCLPGWDKSKGINIELGWAKEMGKKIQWLKRLKKVDIH